MEKVLWGIGLLANIVAFFILACGACPSYSVSRSDTADHNGVRFIHQVGQGLLDDRGSPDLHTRHDKACYCRRHDHVGATSHQTRPPSLCCHRSPLSSRLSAAIMSRWATARSPARAM